MADHKSFGVAPRYFRKMCCGRVCDLNYASIVRGHRSSFNGPNLVLRCARSSPFCPVINQLIHALGLQGTSAACGSPCLGHVVLGNGIETVHRTHERVVRMGHTAFPPSQFSSLRVLCIKLPRSDVTRLSDLTKLLGARFGALQHLVLTSAETHGLGDGIVSRPLTCLLRIIN